MSITIEHLEAVARAFGIWGDYRHSKTPDSFGPLIICKPDNTGFVTTVANDFLRHQGSHIADHDGGAISWKGGWQKCLTQNRHLVALGKNAPKMQETEGQEQFVDHCRLFTAHDATFAAVENFGIPERVFLFINHPNFNIGFVVNSLQGHRARSAGGIYYLDTTKKDANKKTNTSK